MTVDMYKAPQGSVVEPNSEPDLNDLRPGWLVVLAGSLMSIAGLMSALSGLQLTLFVFWYSWLATMVPYIFMVLGVVGLVAGGFMTQGRIWAGAVGLTAMVLLGVLGIAWNVYVLLGVGISLISLLSLVVCWISLAMSAICMPRLYRISRGRRALYSAV